MSKTEDLLIKKKQNKKNVLARELWAKEPEALQKALFFFK